MGTKVKILSILVSHRKRLGPREGPVQIEWIEQFTPNISYGAHIPNSIALISKSEKLFNVLEVHVFVSVSHFLSSIIK